MKKNIKKILGVFLSVLLVIVPIISTNVEDVQAETKSYEGCYRHTNYYFFLHVAGYAAYDNEGDSWDRTHRTWFKPDLPEGAQVEADDEINIEFVDLEKDSRWNKRTFWDYAYVFDDLSPTGEVYKESKDEWFFGHTKLWTHEGKDSEDQTPTSASKEANIESTFITKTTKPEIGSLHLSNNGAKEVEAGVVRTWNKSSWQTFRDKQPGRLDAEGKHPTEGHIWFPALLKAEFWVCDETEEPPVEPELPEDKYKLTINYLEEDTRIEIQPSAINDPIKGEIEYSEGDKYTAVCEETIGDYVLSGKKTHTGTMPGNDHSVDCLYKLKETPITPEEPTEDPTYKVTVNYLDKKTEEPIADPKVTPGFKNGESYLETCPDSLVNGTYVNTPPGYTGSLSGKIAGQDVVINCLYSNENEPTSDIPIYIVWGVGGAALAYSIYYFRKYYKQENNA